MMKKQDRRRFLKATGALAISAIVPSLGCDRNEVTFRSMPTAPDPVPEGTLPSEMPNSPVTPNDRFYLQSINGKDYDPRLKAENWSLRVDGLVDNSIAAMTYDEIIAMPMADRLQMTMQCIGNWVGGPLVGNAWWGGTTFNNLLDSAGVADEAIRVKFYSIDGYTTSIPLERARRDEVLLVWEMNDDVLPSKHGFPVRLVNPGHYGQKMPKWITRIELIDEEYLGYWESKPENRTVKWSDDAVATINSRIDAPISIWDDIKDPGNGGVMVTLQRIVGREGDTFTIHGVAMAGERSVQRLEISTDSGINWTEAHIMTSSAPNVWSTWSYEWLLPPSGRYEIVARATDDVGVRQPPEDKGNDLYDGRTGWHRVPVNVSRSGSV